MKIYAGNSARGNYSGERQASEKVMGTIRLLTIPWRGADSVGKSLPNNPEIFGSAIVVEKLLPSSEMTRILNLFR